MVKPRWQTKPSSRIASTVARSWWPRAGRRFNVVRSVTAKLGAGSGGCARTRPHYCSGTNLCSYQNYTEPSPGRRSRSAVSSSRGSRAGGCGPASACRRCGSWPTGSGCPLDRGRDLPHARPARGRREPGPERDVRGVRCPVAHPARRHRPGGCTRPRHRQPRSRAAARAGRTALESPRRARGRLWRRGPRAGARRPRGTDFAADASCGARDGGQRRHGRRRTHPARRVLASGDASPSRTPATRVFDVAAALGFRGRPGAPSTTRVRSPTCWRPRCGRRDGLRVHPAPPRTRPAARSASGGDASCAPCSRRTPTSSTVEDDHASAIAGAPARTLATVTRSRWAVVRSVAKTLGPDLRVALVTGRRPHDRPRPRAGCASGPDG